VDVEHMTDQSSSMAGGMPAPTAATGWWRWFVPTCLLVLVADLASKAWLFAQWQPGDQPHAWIWLAENTGVAWSLGSGSPWVVIALTIVLIPVLVWVWWSGYRHQGAWDNAAFGLVLGGALGNAHDRIAARFGAMGGVRDFIHVDLGFWPLDPWPTFNLADSGICVGFAILLVRSFRRPLAAT
jgi:signal peptidase II